MTDISNEVRERLEKLAADIDMMCTRGRPLWRGHKDASAVRTLLAQSTEQAKRIEALEGALTEFVEQECDYMRRNNLGDPEKQHAVIRARALLTEGTEKG